MSLPLLLQGSRGLLRLRCANPNHSGNLEATIDQPGRLLILRCSTCFAELWAIPVAVETLITFRGGR